MPRIIGKATGEVRSNHERAWIKGVRIEIPCKSETATVL